ncbi:MAG: hypothetical protein LBK27_06050 [Treponema sp.]|jgi:hypothetical protein|nr:hypothetical protein [Treponema sp.]
MAIKRNYWLLLFLFLPGFSFAQNRDNPAGRDFAGGGPGGNSIRVVETPEGVQIIQRLSWIRDENDFRYEVIIERQNANGSYSQILRQSRTENFIEISLAGGRYRYRILVYNLLDRFEYSTNWAAFTIDRARPPVLRRISPDHVTLTGEDTVWVIELEGTNLLPESELSLRPLAGGETILPVEYTAFPGGNGGRVVFRSLGLAAGRYELCVRNFGGFEARKNCVVLNPFSAGWFASLSAAPPVPVYGYLRDLFDGGIYPPGISFRAGFLPLAGNWGSLGAETGVSWNYLSVTKTGLSASAHFFDVRLNLLYQYTLSPHLALGFRLGGGGTLTPGLSYTIRGYKQAPISTWIPSMNGGLSLQWIFYPRFFAELGLDYVNLFSVDGSQGLLFPFIGFGWKS